MYSFFNVKQAKKYLIANKVIFTITILFLFIGLIAGVLIALKSDDYVKLLTTNSVSITEIITKDYTTINLFFKIIKTVIVPLIILFILGLTKFTSYLGFIYISYQGLLLGISFTSLIKLKGVSGVLNAFLVLLPINILNLIIFVIMQCVIININNQIKINKIKRITAIKNNSPKYVVILILMIISAFIYSVVYPLLLRSSIIINY